jgi:hypothetical protein
MYFLKFFGSTGLDQVLDAMDYAVYVYDVQHIILDNLQFMMSGQGGKFSYDKFAMQVRARSEFLVLLISSIIFFITTTLTTTTTISLPPPLYASRTTRLTLSADSPLSVTCI